MLSDCFSFRRGGLFPDVPCAAVLAWFVPQRFITLGALSKSGGTRSGIFKRWGLIKVLGAHPQGGWTHAAWGVGGFSWDRINSWP